MLATHIFLPNSSSLHIFKFRCAHQQMNVYLCTCCQVHSYILHVCICASSMCAAHVCQNCSCRCVLNPTVIMLDEHSTQGQWKWSVWSGLAQQLFHSNTNKKAFCRLPSVLYSRQRKSSKYCTNAATHNSMSMVLSTVAPDYIA